MIKRRYQAVPSASLKVGDRACNFFESEPAALRFIAVDIPRGFVGAPFCVTAADLEDTRRAWPYAVVPIDEEQTS